MPLIALYALCSADPEQRDVAGELYRGMARHLVEREKAALAVARAMSDVAGANNVRLQPSVAGWQSICQLIEPDTTVGIPPLFLIVRMSPVYHGFDFQPHKAALHAGIRQHLWEHMRGEPGEGGLTVNLGVRLEFVDAAGSTVTAEGRVEGEYGGHTGVVYM